MYFYETVLRCRSWSICDWIHVTGKANVSKVMKIIESDGLISWSLLTYNYCGRISFWRFMIAIRQIQHTCILTYNQIKGGTIAQNVSNIQSSRNIGSLSQKRKNFLFFKNYVLTLSTKVMLPKAPYAQRGFFIAKSFHVMV